ncbi:MAG: C-terminal peptidase prc [Oceanicoccus sp.]|jgi:C-terminal peptidase prc
MKKLLSTLVLATILALPVSAKYADVPNNHTYIEAITYIELEGAADNAENFRPDEVITRAESFKMLFEVLHVETTEVQGGLFDDTPSDAWFTPYAELALEYELISDRMPEFQADKQLRRMDAYRLIMQAYGLSAPVIPQADRPELFNDLDANSSLYPWVYQMVQLDILEANPESAFKAYLPLTRAEFSFLLYEFDTWMQVFELDQFAVNNPDFYKSDIMADIWNTILSDHYLEDDEYIDQDALFQAAVKGMVESLNDPYSKYFTPEEANSFTQSISGEFEGIGAILDQTEEGHVRVSGLIKGGPAAAAGLKTNDLIESIDGVDITELSMQNVISRIKGPEGTNVELGVIRGNENITIEIKRAHIEITLQSGNVIWGDVWYLDIDSFSTDLPGEVMAIIFELEEQVKSPEAIILDLRGNPGGSLQSGTFLTGLFVPHLSPLVQLDYGESYTSMIYNGDSGPYKDYPVYILVDENSASASEIVALTLQENGATVIGHQTYGKGTAQTYRTYWDGSAIKLTIAEWLSGEGASIQDFGVTPDVVLPVDADEEDWLEAARKRL